MGTKFNLVPVVLDSNGAPWAEASIYILSRLEDSVTPNMSSYSSIALDLAAFRRFLDDYPAIDWTNFPQQKLLRPTYRYRAHLALEMKAGTLADTTARRRMSSVIGFYKWLIREEVLSPTNPPWVASDSYIHYTGPYGSNVSKKIETTDHAVKVAKGIDPYSECIEDGGKLRPLPEIEQRWLLEALVSQGNTELTLIHLFALCTGARIQTVLTFKVKDVLAECLISPHSDEVRVPVGPGTGIDTKNDKKMVLHIPIWLYEMLSTYARSERAAKRRVRAIGRDSPDQYLFLTVRGSPFYRSKADSQVYDDENILRHPKSGGSVRQLIKDYLIPTVRRNHDRNFKYRFHDLRASYGMNLTDEQLKRVALGEITLHEAREFVKSRMGHDSSATTDLYLEYRGKLKFARRANNEYAEHLKAVAAKAFKGIV